MKPSAQCCVGDAVDEVWGPGRRGLRGARGMETWGLCGRSRASAGPRRWGEGCSPRRPPLGHHLAVYRKGTLPHVLFVQAGHRMGACIALPTPASRHPHHHGAHGQAYLHRLGRHLDALLQPVPQRRHVAREARRALRHAHHEPQRPGGVQQQARHGAAQELAVHVDDLTGEVQGGREVLH